MSRIELTDNMIPAKATHPGSLLKSEMQERNLSIKELSQSCDISEYILNKIIKNQRNITIDVAVELEKIFNIDTDFWLKLQYNYEKDMLKISKKNEVENSSLPKNIKNRILTNMNLL